MIKPLALGYRVKIQKLIDYLLSLKRLFDFVRNMYMSRAYEIYIYFLTYKCLIKYRFFITCARNCMPGDAKILNTI